MREQRRGALRVGLTVCGAVVATRAVGQGGVASVATGQGETRPLVSGQAATTGRRIVTLGGTITEIVDALGATSRLVGVDDSSLYPPQVKALPRVGYYRSFSVEGIVSLRPDLILASDQSGPASALDRLRSLGLAVRILDASPSLAALESRIIGVADAIDGLATARTLLDGIQRAVAEATRRPHPSRVLVLSSHTGRLMAAGRGTAADAMLTMLGARNLAAGLQGYKPLSGEAVAALAPEVIVTSPLSIGPAGIAAYRQQPGIAATPAARGQRVVVVDDLLLLGFGPRIGVGLKAIANGIDAGGVAARPA